jgi:hypothetical protein
LHIRAQLLGQIEGKPFKDGGRPFDWLKSLECKGIILCWSSLASEMVDQEKKAENIK